ncbi:hypothetical protein EMN47_20230 [Prolixibacteraceae bacterium JC049]|nr:hypothetical protein [Prolixibacteraceae bacterium JC049]
MKKLIFTLVCLVAMVGFSSTVMAQSTALAPYEGSTFTYTIGGLTSGDQITFFITHSTTVPTTSAGSNYTVGSGVTLGTGAAVSGTSADIEITWGVGAAAEVGTDGSYKLWVQVEDGGDGGCSNYRYVEISPVANAIEFDVIALGVGNATAPTDIATITDQEGLSSCPDKFDFDYSTGADGTGSGDDGDTYAYYKVTRTSGTSGKGWTFDFDATNEGSAVAYGNIELSSNGSSFTVATGDGDLDDISVAADVDVYYVRVKVAVSQSTDQAIVSTISSETEADTGLTDSSSNGAATFTVDQVATVGSFTFN